MLGYQRQLELSNSKEEGRYYSHGGNVSVCASWARDRSRWPSRLPPRVPAMTGRFVLGASFPSHPCCCWYNCALPLGLMLSDERETGGEKLTRSAQWNWFVILQEKNGDSTSWSVLSARVALTVQSHESWVEAVTVAGFYWREGPRGNLTIAN